MKSTPEIDSTLLIDSDRNPQAAAPAAVTDFSYQRPRRTAVPSTSTAPKKARPELTTFRELSRQVFGAEATHEFIKEAIIFGWIMLVAAWPLSVALDQLGTMMISPPNALW